MIYDTVCDDHCACVAEVHRGSLGEGADIVREAQRLNQIGRETTEDVINLYTNDFVISVT